MPARRFLCACALALAVCSAAYASPAHAVAVAASECAPDDEQCNDDEASAQKIEEQQKKTEADAAKAQGQIDAVDKQLKECAPGSSECMTKLAGAGTSEKKGVEEMTSTIKGFKTEPGDNASSTSTGVCSGFTATLPGGAGETPFPADQLCSLLGS
ncbi:hypothetical protein [Streptomyces acidiscabies]|uniref:Secreted protein n=1 Tax=Streptomyces acidiscabies TaxID=42234 RepID=A0AAP6BAW5_9ACTN|nr:hypothetical protein [Streptomyces acidiscabies]MBP5935124.1 hypothetical protein [Streptomyces sp. LBUM 1476]MBZ3917074.1 hypothetical protein [Streptomyces acidiscabies]MDX2961314.1 hypothetical protein [Streptomyces acidiscabies]MDX3022672.1 hypothetical protein [Streptomyces acidiscabies]MDX3792036.1 hypothetical protein [Streptomyces acidiscabies]